MKKRFFFSLMVIGLFFVEASAANHPRNHRGGTNVAGTPVRTHLNINNISTIFKNDGISDIDAQELNSGFVFPKGSYKTAVYQSGFLWGGIVLGEIRVGGSAYRTGLQGGRILPNGAPTDPEAPDSRIFRVRADVSPYESLPDMLSDDFSSEIADQGITAGEIRSQYETDWNEWPASQGAPYADVNQNGSYDPTTDIPGYPGADQTIWFVANDLNNGLTTWLYGSSPIGLELQVTAWGYNKPGALDNAIFRRYVLINKSAQTVDSMYVSQFSDIDLGSSTDDFAGCDTVNNASLGFTYNASAVDLTYDPLPPPAVGFDFLQGPLVPAPGDSAIFDGHRLYGKRNLPMTAFAYFTRGDVSVTDPTQGSYEGTTQWYNFFRGRVGKTGALFTDPDSNKTTFALAGNPVAGTGWIDGQLIASGDRRIALSSGPFTLAPGDTQEVVVAEIAAGATVGVDHLAAITLLKAYDAVVQSAYDDFFRSLPDDVSFNEAAVPSAFALGQNYPNPFNPATSIGYTLPSQTHVRISIFNLLGQEVARLVDAVEPPGSKVVSFDASGLSSGVYACRMTAGTFTSVRRIVFAK